MTTKTKVRLFLTSLVLALPTILVLSMYGEYGGHNISLAIFRYMEKNDGRWPSSWKDIEPYHEDPLLSMQSTVVVRQFWDVNWNVDPQQLISESKVTPRPKPSIEEEVLPVVFNRKWYPRDGRVPRWVLSPVIQRLLDKKERDQSPGEISAPAPR
ncbi:MAG: hypothetical protein EOP84_13740 [Verrucomicrobiaceae bacterium]|nr:MAG: hypothetical protein EOP84_13740 [Verrucomicrobiaceae bacterium]